MKYFSKDIGRFYVKGEYDMDVVATHHFCTGPDREGFDVHEEVPVGIARLEVSAYDADGELVEDDGYSFDATYHPDVYSGQGRISERDLERIMDALL